MVAGVVAGQGRADRGRGAVGDGLQRGAKRAGAECQNQKSQKQHGGDAQDEQPLRRQLDRECHVVKKWVACCKRAGTERVMRAAAVHDEGMI